MVVVRFQGPRANGMPELHELTPALGVFHDRGLRVELVTDGRMSGASGTVLAAIHCRPEAADGGPLAYLRHRDVIRVDASAGILEFCGADVFLRTHAAMAQWARAANCSSHSAIESAARMQVRRSFGELMIKGEDTIDVLTQARVIPVLPVPRHIGRCRSGGCAGLGRSARAGGDAAG